MTLDNLFSKLKGGPKSGNFGHAGIPGKRGGSISKSQIMVNTAIDKTKDLIGGKGLEDQDIYVDKDARSISTARSPEQLKKEMGDPIRTELLFDKKPDLKPQALDRKVIDFLDEKSRSDESLRETLNRELRNAPKRSIPLSSVNITQKYIFQKPLQKYMKSKSYGSDLYLVKTGGKYYVHNNNHKVSAAIINGEQSLNFSILDVD